LPYSTLKFTNKKILKITLAGKITLISLKMAERNEAKKIKQTSYLEKFDAKLRFALLASLRSAFFEILKITTNWSLYQQKLNMSFDNCNY